MPLRSGLNEPMHDLLSFAFFVAPMMDRKDYGCLARG